MAGSASVCVNVPHPIISSVNVAKIMAANVAAMSISLCGLFNVWQCISAWPALANGSHHSMTARKKAKLWPISMAKWPGQLTINEVIS